MSSDKNKQEYTSVNHTCKAMNTIRTTNKQEIGRNNRSNRAIAQ